MAVWFSASAVVPVMRTEFPMSGLMVSLLSSSVQIGFVVGTIVSATLSLADRIEPRRFFMLAALAAAIATGLIPLLWPGTVWTILLRFVTGACMAGVYPVGMKIASTWAQRDMGLLVGLIVGALTLGTALPHAFSFLGGVDWRLTLWIAAASAVVGGLLVTRVSLGRPLPPAPPLSLRNAGINFQYAPLRLTNFGYLGHMWELYAMWAWIGAFFQASFSARFNVGFFAGGAELLAFATIGAGAVGSVLAGLLADRIGRTLTTIAAMLASGSCALSIGFLFNGPLPLLAGVALLWGITIVADSAQFSASVAELSPPELLGTALTVQVCAGFLLTTLSIHLVPVFVQWWGWKYAFAPLAAGPIIGIAAMALLRRHPDATRLAGGRR
ncbi:sugar phosphate permease [Paralcaligenes ureilyticus]|uniref:Sugar phosphate permease n=2 Tax=Paralcaligenes ureilyticus TaxID=627131 RepID=A0A4R3M033_9BURK|nr:sugar phosphate permease [Paralcaligenes ureilyticus]